MLFSHLRLDLPSANLFPVEVLFKMFEVLLASPILAARIAHFTLIHLITLAIVGTFRRHYLAV